METAVIGVPDELRGEVLEAFVVLRSGDSGDEELAAELQQLVKDEFTAHAYPRTVHFVDELPNVPRQVVGSFSGSGKLGTSGSAAPTW
ncbi:AMP-binding enzyme, partial [Blastococcus saxobsidens]|uniref:AMP-binding enzyme n=1 Tax=Blastococcus saxobsidens TaxID=138336 RepID=UPI003D2F7A76